MRDAVPSLAALIAAFVADEPEAEQLSEHTWRFAFPGRHGTFSVFVAANGAALLAAATRIDPVPADRIGAVQELIVDLNSDLLLSWFDCHRSNGVVSARASVDTQGVEVTPTLIGNVVGAAVEAMQRFLPAIDAVALGELDPAQLRQVPGPDTAAGLSLSEATPEEIEAFFDELAGAGDDAH